MKSKIKAGMLVNRHSGHMLMLVLEVGEDYYEGFALCRTIDDDPKEFWIDKCLLEPLPSDLLH